jgi:small subunit ribosomal protein S1
MADTEVNPPAQRTAESAKADSATKPSALDVALDAAMGAISNRGSSEPPNLELPLKRQWDQAMEAELEAALAGFDPAAVAGESPGTGKSARPARGAEQRGQEVSPGLRTGKVIGVRGKSIFVDLGGKSEGVLPVDQYEGDLPLPGSSIEVMVERFDPEEGLLKLRRKGAAIDADWETLRKGVIVEARVTKAVKGGLEVDVDGIRGFLPISQIDLSRVDDTATYINQKFKALVTEANQREKNLVISRRELLEQERAELRERTWASLEEGQVHDAVVRSIKGFGAFVDIGGVDGLLPIGEMSWGRISKVDDLLKTGDQIKVKVLKIDRTTRKLTLGLKQLSPSPWDTANARYPRGTTVKGKVTRIMDFGAFVELEPGIEGLIHISELSPNRVRRVADIVKPDQEVEVRILKVELEDRRIGLSLRPAAKAPSAVEAPDESEDPADDAPPPERPEPKIPLKGGLGDRDIRRKQLRLQPGDSPLE